MAKLLFKGAQDEAGPLHRRITEIKQHNLE